MPTLSPTRFATRSRLAPKGRVSPLSRRVDNPTWLVRDSCKRPQRVGSGKTQDPNYTEGELTWRMVTWSTNLPCRHVQYLHVKLARFQGGILHLMAYYPMLGHSKLVLLKPTGWGPPILLTCLIGGSYCWFLSYNELLNRFNKPTNLTGEH